MNKYYLIFIFIFSTNSYSLTYQNREHSFNEIIADQGIVFTGHLVGYFATQWQTIKDEGSFEKYQDNFLQFNFDSDNIGWNYIGHPYTGSQVYLYYRARGYEESESLYLSFLSSLWFEILIETYTEKPSLQDTFNTPLFGSALGYLFEKTSVYLINQESSVARFLGRAMNPFSFLVDDNLVSFMPYFKGKDDYMISLSYRYD